MRDIANFLALRTVMLSSDAEAQQAVGLYSRPLTARKIEIGSGSLKQTAFGVKAAEKNATSRDQKRASVPRRPNPW